MRVVLDGPSGVTLAGVVEYLAMAPRITDGTGKYLQIPEDVAQEIIGAIEMETRRPTRQPVLADPDQSARD
jgi:hypothetical protein